MGEVGQSSKSVRDPYRRGVLVPAMAEAKTHITVRKFFRDGDWITLVIKNSPRFSFPNGICRVTQIYQYTLLAVYNNGVRDPDTPVLGSSTRCSRMRDRDGAPRLRTPLANGQHSVGRSNSPTLRKKRRELLLHPYELNVQLDSIMLSMQHLGPFWNQIGEIRALAKRVRLRAERARS